MEFSSRSLIGSVLLILVSSGCLWAQGSGALTGTISDPTDAAVCGAEVTLTNPAIGVVRAVKTGCDGVYLLPQLAPAIYKLEISAKGFKRAIRDQVVVPVGLTSTLNVHLAVGAPSELVEVAATTSAVNTQDASLGTPFNEQQIIQLPLEGRSIVGLLSLQAGAVYLPTQDMRSGSINGGRSDQANITLDGVDVNDPGNQTVAYTSSLRTPLDSVIEFRTTTSNYGADEGRSGGAQVQLVTKSGTNSLHGSVYAFNRNTAFSSNEFFNKLAGLETPKLNKQIYGASAGGPIIKNRLFIFANYEILREDSQDPLLRAVPSESLRDGVIIYECANPAQCPASTVAGLTGAHAVPAGDFGTTPAEIASIDPLGIGPNPAVVSHFMEYPTPNDPGLDGLNLVGFRFNAPIHDDFNTAVSRIDFKVNESGTKTLFWRGNLQDDTDNGDPQFPGQPPSTVERVTNKGMAVGYVDVLRTNLVNTFHWGFTRIEDTIRGTQTQPQVSFLDIDDLPAITPTTGRRTPTNDFRDDLSWQHGHHNLQFGADVRFIRIPRSTNANSYSSVLTDITWGTDLGRTFTPGLSTCYTPGCSLVPAVNGAFVSDFDYSLGDIFGVLIRGSGNYNYNKDGSSLPSGALINRRFASDQYEEYVQDVWHLRPSLTATVGLRYSLFSPPWETNGLQVCANPGFGEVINDRRNAAAAGIPSNAATPLISYDLCGPANGKKGFYSWSTKDFAPRVALAWNPRFESGLKRRIFGDGKTVLRGGYSIVHDNIGQALAQTYDGGQPGAGAFGLAASLSAPFGVLDPSNAPRFTGLNNLPGSPVIPPAPPGGFPAMPPDGSFIGTNSINDLIKSTLCPFD